MKGHGARSRRHPAPPFKEASDAVGIGKVSGTEPLEFFTCRKEEA